MTYITWTDFEKIEMRVGTIISAEEFIGARNPAYKLVIDFGEKIGRRKSSAQITTLYTAAQLVGKQIIAVVNFPPKQIGTFMSECLVLGAVGADGEIILVSTERNTELGQRIA